jgi:hypothetical protein
MRWLFFILTLFLLISCQATEMGRTTAESASAQTTSKQVLLSTTWRDPMWEDSYCWENCDQYYLVITFSLTAAAHSLYDKGTKKKVAGTDKIYPLSNLDNDSYVRTSDGEVASYVISGKNLEVCFQGENCYSFYQE